MFYFAAYQFRHVEYAIPFNKIILKISELNVQINTQKIFWVLYVFRKGDRQKRAHKKTDGFLSFKNLPD